MSKTIKKKVYTLGKEKLLFQHIAEDCLPRERLEAVGEKALSNQELLAILLRTGSKNVHVMNLAAEFLKQFDQLYNLKNATMHEMMQVKGIGKVKAIELRAAIELGSRITQSTQMKFGKIVSSYQIAQTLMNELQNFQQEHLVCLFLNTKNDVIKQETIFIGSLNQSIAHPRDIFRAAVKYSAARLIVAHNHPSGNPTPSENNIHFTQRIVECGELMGIEILDHIIVGQQAYTSMREEKFFNGN